MSDKSAEMGQLAFSYTAHYYGNTTLSQALALDPFYLDVSVGCAVHRSNKHTDRRIKFTTSGIKISHNVNNNNKLRCVSVTA